ncbi:hypothetical protein PIN31009_01898 [Pandoraea iniqua]|uniref:hypothetical protein n=1 Tax=Pandoraea iniqua TaxID=2508288 RepID=UPI00123EF571|nr:hypothetical protein [Pandoraea iniqua]VVD96429.1 hypothetical protein PIN31009_01898 [Pandoraea iniqua]
MGKSLLQLVQKVTGELGLVIPTAVAGNTSQDIIQIAALMNAVGDESQAKFCWQALDTEYRFTTAYQQIAGNTTNGSPIVSGLASTAGILPGTFMVTGLGVPQDCYVLSVDSVSQVTLNQNATVTATGSQIVFAQTKYTMPADYDRLIDRTQWDKSKHWEMLGPESPQQWQWIKSGYIATGPRVRWRVLGGYFQVWPALNTSEYLGLEYTSKYWARDATGTPKDALTQDTDTSIFSDRMMVIGTKLKYFEIKGFDTTALKRDFDSEFDIRMATEQGGATLSMAPRLSQVLVGPENTPDSGYGFPG